jgi:hypothetical protein
MALPQIPNIPLSRCSAMETTKMKRATIWAVLVITVGASMACSGGSPTVPTPTPTPTPTPANIAGNYDMTLIASSTCSDNLPAATRLLKYTANINQTGSLNTLFIMTLSGDVSFGEVLIAGGIDGQTLKINQFTFSEKTTGGGIAILATGTATVGANGTITGTLAGVYQTPLGASCNSTVHQIGLVKK